MNARPKALLFDLGNVLVRVDFERVLAHWARAAGVPLERLRARFVIGEEYARHERGELDDAGYFAALRAMLGLELDDATMERGWNAVFDGEVPGMADLVGGLAERVPLFAFSNTNPAHHAFWSVHFASLMQPFREVFVSHRLGMRKPEARAYLAVCAAMRREPGEVLFFDDNAHNVEGARAIGMRAVTVAGIADVHAALAQAGLDTAR